LEFLLSLQRPKTQHNDKSNLPFPARVLILVAYQTNYLGN